MISKEETEKNIKDLEYNRLLNKENIVLVLIGTAIISIILTEKLPESFRVTKFELLFFMFIALIIILLYFGKKLDEKTEELKNLYLKPKHF